MLKHSLRDHAAECFYSDKRLASFLWDNLPKVSSGFSTEEWNSFYDRFYYLLTEGVEARYPRQHRLTDIRQLIGYSYSNDLFVTAELPWLEELQNRLLERCGNLPCYRKEEVQTYVRFASFLDPTILVSWHVSRWLEEDPSPNVEDIISAILEHNTFFTPQEDMSRQYAEGHVHFWGVTADNAILSGHILSPKKEDSSDKESTQPKMNFWEEEELAHTSTIVGRCRQILALLFKSEHSSPLDVECLFNAVESNHGLPDWILLAENNSSAETGSSEWLLLRFSKAITNAQGNHWLLLNVYLFSLYNQSDTHPSIRIAILYFWQSVNTLRKSLIMDGQGLTRFVERYSNSPLSLKGDKQSIVNRIWASKHDVAEIKSAPHGFNSNFVSEITSSLLTNMALELPKPPAIFEEDEISIDDEQATKIIKCLERWHYCGHFSRSQTHEKNQRPSPKSNDIWKQARKLTRNLETVSVSDIQSFLGGSLNHRLNFQPYHWFRGLDVAGDENALKIEWFAPILRWLRSKGAFGQDSKVENESFHLSIHAGEDYAHPASGMRHVDETVKFCEMKTRDRLGHALSLGIEPRKWIERQGEMVLPLDEHLDNLVWMWEYTNILGQETILADKVRPILEKRINRFWRESLWWREPNHMTSTSIEETDADFNCSQLKDAGAKDLYSSWKLRRNCNYHFKTMRDGEFVTAKDEQAVPDYEILRSNTCLASKLFFARHNWLEMTKEERLVVVRLEDNKTNQSIANCEQSSGILEDLETPDELEFMHALQDWLLTEYNELGLVIEANPTSNVYIARLESYSEHPIFRWNPPDPSVLEKDNCHNLYNLRRGPVNVLINTDDPGIMPTTLRTEYQLLHSAALDLDVDSDTAKEWLEKIQQFSVEVFERNHLRAFEVS